ncbi:uncharacterized protein LOC119666661 [Teleopsis dalmanni]|uniref:uncharacterized protein LOC119666661 n=1 Tax=Teleopsis dalmanni TaxID=139649 RepID=UPI0018CF5693|nr:uncharacterized protein LOC119666661 [Teleopsis dalmanni]
MRPLSAAILLTTFCYLTLLSITNVYGSRSKAFSNILNRKPLVSPEHPPALQYYKRTKRGTPHTIKEFRNYLTNIKQQCGSEMGFQPKELEKNLLYQENVTPKEKCLLECILKRSGIMNKSNRLSTRSVGRIAELVSQNNVLVVSIAVASAEKCNKFINAPDPCEAAYQCTKCIANEMKSRKFQAFY